MLIKLITCIAFFGNFNNQRSEKKLKTRQNIFVDTVLSILIGATIELFDIAYPILQG
jgi:hypothetical protein